MNKREKIIVLLAVFAAFYGILDYFVFSSSKTGADEKISSEALNETSHILGKIDTGLLSLASMGKNNNQTDYQMSMIESEWKRNPFEKPVGKSPGKKETATPGATQDFVYSGFIQVGQKIFVIINGMEYTKGDTIKDSDYKIFKVTPNSVVLIYDENKQMILHLKEG